MGVFVAGAVADFFHEFGWGVSEVDGHWEIAIFLDVCFGFVGYFVGDIIFCGGVETIVADSPEQWGLTALVIAICEDKGQKGLEFYESLREKRVFVLDEQTHNKVLLKLWALKK